MNNILIVTGGNLDIEFAREYIKTLSFDKVFAVDKGLEYADCLALLPDYIVGDFDTVKTDVLSKYEKMIQTGECCALIERHPAKKDATDTELAVRRAITFHPKSITILGATGSRLDHILMNVGILLQIETNGILGQIVDANNRIRLLDAVIQNDRTKAKPPYSVCMVLNREEFITDNKEKYLSVIPMSPEVKGLTMEGVMYPLSDKTITQGDTLTVSNQITEKQACIYLKTGRILIIEAKD